jgi:hypothetical protein
MSEASGELQSFVVSLPRMVYWQEVVQFERVNERVSAVSFVLKDSVGVQEAELCWAPEEFPPSEAQMLAWAWVVRPDLADPISELAGERLRAVMAAYAEAAS